MRDVIAKYAAQPAPRYTSYPTAPHFETPFDERTARDWYAAIDQQRPISLYIHVPFCRRMCWYCGCNMKLVTREGPLKDYVASLLREIELVAAAAPRGLVVDHLHFGGGTPTALVAEDFARIVDAVFERFDKAPDAELAVEADPRTLERDMVAMLGRLGFNRASIGVQEFDPKVQTAINREQPPEMVARATEALRSVGVSRVNFDLIYGLPHQTTDAIRRTAAVCAEMAPDRLALFGYAHVPWMAKNQRMIELDALPGPAQRMDQAAAAAQSLEAAGYEPIGIDHFARPDDPLAAAARTGALRRNFQGYTTDAAETLIGLGATSIGRTAQGYLQNIVETGAWSRAIEAGRLPIAKGRAFSGDDALRAHVIERLMCDFQVDLGRAGTRFGAPAGWAAESLRRLQSLVDDRAVHLDGDRVTIAQDARTLARVVAAAFDAYFGGANPARAPARHSAAV